MEKTRFNRHMLFAMGIISLLLCGALVPSGLADTQSLNTNGFDRGVSWKPMIPMKRTTLVNFDPNSYLDDYSYLAAVPTTVFYDKTRQRIFSNPLLYYQDEHTGNEKERTLNARQGLDYFMEDWMSYCNGYLDQMTLINVPKNKLDTSWNAKNYTLITGDTPYEIANTLALHDWSYTDNAVVAVINETFQKPKNIWYIWLVL